MLPLLKKLFAAAYCLFMVQTGNFKHPNECYTTHNQVQLTIQAVPLSTEPVNKDLIKAKTALALHAEQLLMLRTSGWHACGIEKKNGKTGIECPAKKIVPKPKKKL